MSQSHEIRESERLWTRNALAEALCIDRRSVHNRLEDLKPDGYLNDRYPGWFLRNAIPRLFARTEAGDVVDPDDLSPKERRDWWEGTKTMVNLQEKAGELIPVDDVRRQMSTLVQSIISEFETLPDILERDCGADPGMVLRVQAAVDKVRESTYHRIREEE